MDDAAKQERNPLTFQDFAMLVQSTLPYLRDQPEAEWDEWMRRLDRGLTLGALKAAFDPDDTIGREMDQAHREAETLGDWIRFTCFACPTQAEGKLTDGRMFYFRARHGTWDLRVSDEATDDVGDAVRGQAVADGDDETEGWMSPKAVAAIVLDQLGAKIAAE